MYYNYNLLNNLKMNTFLFAYLENKLMLKRKTNKNLVSRIFRFIFIVPKKSEYPHIRYNKFLSAIIFHNMFKEDLILVIRTTTTKRWSTISLINKARYLTKIISSCLPPAVNSDL